MSKLKELKSLLALHPKGTHLCLATGLVGYSLDAEMLIGMVEEIETLRAVIGRFDSNIAERHEATEALAASKERWG